jgi:hypothetical protein
MMGIDQTDARQELAKKKAAVQNEVQVAEAQHAQEMEAATSTSVGGAAAQLAAEEEHQLAELEAMKAAHQAKMEAIGRQKAKMHESRTAEIAIVAESNNPFLNPFAVADEVSEPVNLNPFGADMGGSAGAPVKLDAKAKAKEFSRKLTMVKAKAKATEVAEVMPWFGTKSAELFEAEADFEIMKKQQQTRIAGPFGFTMKIKMIVAKANAIGKKHKPEVEKVQAKMTEGGADVKHKDKLVHTLDTIEKEIKEDNGNLARDVGECEMEVEQKLNTGNRQFRTDIGKQELKFSQEGMEANELDYIANKYKFQLQENEKVYTAALTKLSNANEAIMKNVTPVVEGCTSLIATLLFPEEDSPAARQAAMNAGAAKHEEKKLAYKVQIHQRAHSAMGDTKYDKASIVKYIEKVMEKKEAYLKKMVGGIGKDSLHGLLFMAGPKVEKPWEARRVYIDLRDKKVIVKTEDNKKTVKEAMLSAIRAASYFPRTEKRMQADGKSCDFAFSVMVQPPGNKPMESWNFSAFNEFEMNVWKSTFDALPPPQGGRR